MIIPLGMQDWGSLTQDASRFRLHNMYLTDNPATPDGVSRVSRPTLTPFITLGTGPINGMFRQESVLNGDWFVVSGTALYRYSTVTGFSTLLGTVSGSGFCQFAGVEDKVVIVKDGKGYWTDGVSVTQIVMPDSLPVGSVATINSYFILSVLGSQRFYWLSPGDTDPDALSFASAERLPDAVMSVHVISDEVWFVGASGPEVWSPSGDPDAPFQRISGRVYSDGCVSRDTSINVVFNDSPAAMWVTDTKSVVVAQGGIQKISNESVEELLKTATNFRAWSFRHNRHDFYILTTDQFTIAYDLSKNTWMRWDTYLSDNWQAHLGLQTRDTAYAGDISSNQIWRLDEGTDDNGLPVIRECSGNIDNFDKPLACNMVYAKVNTGWSPNYGFEPQLELRWSDDQGTTWGPYYNASLGDRGKYDTSVQFRSLGVISRPGRIFEFRFSDIARFRLDYATMNEPN